MTPTQQKIEEIATRRTDAKISKLPFPVKLFKVYEEMVNHATTLERELIATQPLLERVEELEQDKNTKEDIVWNLKQQIQHLQSQLTTLEAACAEKNEALNTILYHKDDEVHGTIVRLSAHNEDALFKAINNSTSGQRILEENRKKEELLCQICSSCERQDSHLPVSAWLWFIEHKKNCQHFSTNQLNQGK